MMGYGNYPDLASVRRILVIKLRHHGDVLLTSPLFSVLQDAMPHAEIDAYIYRDTLPMLDGHPAISKFHLYDRDWKSRSAPSRLATELRMFRKIRQSRYDMVINLTEGDRGAITGWISGARYRIGWDGGTPSLWRKSAYTHNVKRPQLPRHMTEQNLDAARRIGVFPTSDNRRLFFHVPEVAHATISRLLGQSGINPQQFVLIHPTSRWLFKCWPLEKTAELVNALHAHGHAIVLSSGPDGRELEMIGRIVEQCRNVPLLNLSGKLTLKELGGLIASSRCLICVDSVPLHLASALKTPVVALFGPSSDIAWGPWMHPTARVVAQSASCRPCNLDGCGGGKVADCLATLPLSEVLKNTLSLVGRGNAKLANLRSSNACS